MALLRPEFDITYTGGRVERVHATPKDLVAFERQYQIPLGEANPHAVEYLYYMAWVAMHNAGREPRNFDDFLGVIDGVEEREPGDGDKAADPTQPGQSPG